MAHPDGCGATGERAGDAGGDERCAFVVDQGARTNSTIGSTIGARTRALCRSSCAGERGPIAPAPGASGACAGKGLCVRAQIMVTTGCVAGQCTGPDALCGLRVRDPVRAGDPGQLPGQGRGRDRARRACTGCGTPGGGGRGHGSTSRSPVVGTGIDRRHSRRNTGTHTANLQRSWTAAGSRAAQLHAAVLAHTRTKTTPGRFATP